MLINLYNLYLYIIWQSISGTRSRSRTGDIMYIRPSPVRQATQRAHESSLSARKSLVNGKRTTYREEEPAPVVEAEATDSQLATNLAANLAAEQEYKHAMAKDEAAILKKQEFLAATHTARETQQNEEQML